jgi:hypothetical protein
MGVELALLAVSAAISAYSAIQQGEQQEEWADYQADQADADARAEEGAAKVEAERIRKLARLQAGEANASLAASGVKLGEGSALNINKDIYARAEEDAVMAAFGGADRKARTLAEADGARIKGKQAANAGMVSAAGTVLQTGATAYSGWKKSKSSAAAASAPKVA